MITQHYIDSFKKTHVFKIISAGLIEGEIEKVILGQRPYRITSQYEMEDTIPSQVLICMHILIYENKLTSNALNEAFMRINVNSKVICLLLGYLNAYLIYQKDHEELKLDFRTLLDKYKSLEFKFQQLPCYRNLMTSIEKNM